AGRHVGGLDDVLDGDRHAVDRRQRPAVGPALRRIVGGLARAVTVDHDKGADGFVELGNPGQRLFEIGARAELTGAQVGAMRDIAAQLVGAHAEIVHGRTAGVSSFIPRARHIRYNSIATYSGAP